MKITPVDFSSLHFFVGSFSSLSRKAGRVGSRRIKPLPLAVGEGPYFESARGLLGGTWGLKAG